MEGTTMEEGSELFEIDAGDGKTLYVEVRRGDSIRNLQERLRDAGVAMDISMEGSSLDNDVNALAYLSALSHKKSAAGEKEEIAGASQEVIEDDPRTYCSVFGCPTNKFDHPEVALFMFPPQNKRCEDWIAAINRPELASESVSALSQKYTVCANHFAREQFVNRERKALKQNAVPIIFKGNQSDSTKVNQLKTIAEEVPVAVKIELEDYISNPSLPSPSPMQVEVDANEDAAVHPGSLCRLCAKPISTSAVFIFKLDSNGKSIADKINASLPMMVKKTDNLPKQICQTCAQQVSLHNTFVQSCMVADQKLRSITHRFLVHGLQKPRDATDRRGKSKQSYCCPLCCNGAMLQPEPTDAPSPPPPSALPQEVLSGLYSDEEPSDAEEGVEDDILVKLEETAASETPFIANDMTLLTFDCDICEEVFINTSKSMEHCKLHFAPGYCPCIVCGIVFDSDEELSDHFADHITNMKAPRRLTLKPMLECVTCESKFMLKKDFILHKCATPVLKTLTYDFGEMSCEECERSFASVARAEVHRETHAGILMHTCPQCEFDAETSAILLDHIATMHEGQLVYSCSDCGLRFRTPELLEKHGKVHDNLSYECSFCDVTFGSLKQIQMHIAVIHGYIEAKAGEKKSELRCTKCSKTFAHRSLLQHHLENTHDTIKRMPSLIQYQCKLCGERITSSTEVLNHRTVHFKSSGENWPYVCEYCGEAYPSPNGLARHRRLMHPEERPYVCTVCDVSTRTLYEARVHRKTHTGYVPTLPKPQQKIYQCEHCPSLFTDKLSYVSHRKSHRVAKMFDCEHCDKKFPERHRLNVHKRQHTGEKPYSCGTCGKRFAQTSALYTHALLHTGEMPHECDLCGRKFRIKADRDNHRRTHTGEKPYKCQYCSKTFRTGQVYYQHRMIHTGERRFPCDICGRAFKRSHTLVCHKRIHTGEKPNVCDICGKGFRQRSDMRKHKMNLHNVAA